MGKIFLTLPGEVAVHLPVLQSNLNLILPEEKVYVRSVDF